MDLLCRMCSFLPNIFNLFSSIASVPRAFFDSVIPVHRMRHFFSFFVVIFRQLQYNFVHNRLKREFQ